MCSTRPLLPRRVMGGPEALSAPGPFWLHQRTRVRPDGTSALGPLAVISRCGDPRKLDTRDSEFFACDEFNFVLNHPAYPPALAKRLRHFDCANNDIWPRSIIQVGNNVRLKPTLGVWREPSQLEIKQLLQTRQHLSRVLLFVRLKDQSDRQGGHAADSSTQRFNVRWGSNCDAPTVLARLKRCAHIAKLQKSRKAASFSILLPWRPQQGRIICYRFG